MSTDTGSINYTDLVLQARRVGTALLKEAPEGTVALSSLAGIEKLIAVLGCLWSGRTFLALPDSGTVSQEVARRCSVTFVIGAPISGWATRPFKELQNYPPLKEPVKRAAEKAAWIKTTSGSTGIPKCVPESNHVATWKTQLHLDEVLVKPDDVLTTLGAAWNHISLASLLVGATLEVFDVQNQGPAGLSDWLERRGITNVHTYTAMLRLLLASRTQLLPKLQTVCVFGEPLLRREFEGFNLLTPKGARLINGYGSTEIGMISQFIYSNGDPIPQEPIPAGYAFPGVKIEINETHGGNVPTGEVGEITIESEQVPEGYIGSESDAFVHGPNGVRQFRTGDIGRLDLAGNLTVLGRLDDMVKIRGRQVLLKDVQTAIESHPSINEAFVTRYFRSDGEPRLCAHLSAGFQIGGSIPTKVRNPPQEFLR